MLPCAARETGMNRRFFVYILTNGLRGVLYVGVTNDLIRRLSEHKAKLVPGFTKRMASCCSSITKNIRPCWKLGRAKRRSSAGDERGKSRWLIVSSELARLDRRARAVATPCPGCGAARARLREWCTADPGPPRTQYWFVLVTFGVCNGPGSAAHHYAIKCTQIA